MEVVDEDSQRFLEIVEYDREMSTVLMKVPHFTVCNRTGLSQMEL
jgi:hypothetical protein